MRKLWKPKNGFEMGLKRMTLLIDCNIMYAKACHTYLQAPGECLLWQHPQVACSEMAESDALRLDCQERD